MKRLLTILALVLIALSVLVWRMPASVLRLFMPPDAARVVQLHRIDGTVWRGSALVSVTAVPPALPLTWSCRPQLSPLGVRCELGDAVAGSVVLNAVTSEVVAERLSTTLPLRVTAGAQVVAQSPRVVADVVAATLARDRLVVKGNLRGQDAAYRLGNTDIALGEVSVDCAPSTTAADGSVCTLANRGGSARIDGRLQLAPRAVTGSVELTPAGGVTQRFGF